MADKSVEDKKLQDENGNGVDAIPSELRQASPGKERFAPPKETIPEEQYEDTDDGADDDDEDEGDSEIKEAVKKDT